MKRTITYNVELTDTFGGEANYSWVKRYTFTVPESASDLTIIRKAKQLAGLTNVPCRKESMGDMFALYPAGACVVCFISY